LGTELVLLDFDSGNAFFEADHPSTSHQLQGTLVVQLGGPTNGHFQASSGEQDMLGGEQDPIARYVYGLAVAGLFPAALVQYFVSNFPFYREAIGMTPVALFILM